MKEISSPALQYFMMKSSSPVFVIPLTNLVLCLFCLWFWWIYFCFPILVVFCFNIPDWEDFCCPWLIYWLILLALSNLNDSMTFCALYGYLETPANHCVLLLGELKRWTASCSPLLFIPLVILFIPMLILSRFLASLLNHW